MNSTLDDIFTYKFKSISGNAERSVFVYSVDTIDLSGSWEMSYGRDPSADHEEPGLFMRYVAPGKRWVHD